MSPNIYVGVDWRKRTSTWVAINDQQEKGYWRFSHASPNGCLECAERKEKEIEKEWMKLDIEKKLLNLFRRVRRLEAWSASFTLVKPILCHLL